MVPNHQKVGRIYDSRSHFWILWRRGDDAQYYRPRVRAVRVFSPLIGIIMSTSAEERFDKGRFVIVPALPDATSDQTREWHENPSKPYKIREVELDTGEMTEYFDDTDKTWAELDGEPVDFQNRPQTAHPILILPLCLLHASSSMEHTK